MANTKVKAEQLEAAQTNITSLGTLTALTVDDITIDGSTISDGGDLTIDVAGDINLDADGGDINFKDGGTTYGFASKYNNDLWLGNSISDGDVTIRGNDGGSSISALTFDMSDAGAASFNSSVGVGTASPNIFSFTGATNHVGIQASGTNQWGLLTIAGTGTGAAGISLGAGSVRHALVASANGSNLVFYTNPSNSGTSLTERIRIRANGGVGIGTAGYDSQILAVNAGTGDTVLYGESTDANCFASFRDNSSTANISYGAIGNNHVLRSDQNERMRIDSSGKVGIGSNSPIMKLHVKGATGDAPSNDSNPPANGLAIFDSGGGYSLVIGTDDSNTGSAWIQSQSANVSSSEYDLLLNPNGGDVGIGTTNPKRMLQVGDNTQAIAALSLQTTTSGLSRIYMGDNDNTSAEYTGLISYTHSSDDMQFWANGGEMFRLQPNCFSFGGGSTSHGRIRQYHYAIAMNANTTVALLQNNSGAHTDVNFIYWIEAYHSSRTYRTGHGTFGGYGLYKSSAGQGLDLTITAVSSGIKRLDFAASSLATTAYIGMLIFGDTALTVHNGTLGDMI